MAAGVAVEHVAAEPQQCHRRLDHHQPFVLAVQGDEPRLRTVREIDKIATGVHHLLGGEVLARPLAGEEEASQRFDAAVGRAGCDGRLQVFRVILVARAAGAQGGCQHWQKLFGARLGQFRDESPTGDPRAHAEGGAQLRLDGRQRVRGVAALRAAELGKGLLQDAVEPLVDRVCDCRLQSSPQGTGLGASSLGEHLVGRVLEERTAPGSSRTREARRHPGLEGEAAQQPLAEGVDGLHLEAAGRLQRAGEERAGRHCTRATSATGSTQLARACACRLASSAVTHSASRANSALRHLRGGGLGVGERTGCVSGWRAAQQQARDPHGQHVGLAGAGVGAHPGGGGRVGGSRLVAPRLRTRHIELRFEEEAHLSPPRLFRPTILPRGRGGHRRRSGS